MKLHIMQFSPISCRFIHVWSKYSQHSVLKHPKSIDIYVWKVPLMYRASNTVNWQTWEIPISYVLNTTGSTCGKSRLNIYWRGQHCQMTHVWEFPLTYYTEQGRQRYQLPHTCGKSRLYLYTVLNRMIASTAIWCLHAFTCNSVPVVFYRKWFSSGRVFGTNSLRNNIRLVAEFFYDLLPCEQMTRAYITHKSLPLH
jgi:hypothetical protein